MDLDMVREWICAFADQTTEHVILLLDRDLRVRWANAAAGTVLCADTASIVGGPVHRFFTERDLDLGIPEHEAAIAASVGVSENDRWMVRADGSRFWATGRTVALADVDGQQVGSLKIFRDQTDVWMRIRTLQNRIEALEAAEERRVAAMAMLSHELRNPLSIISVYADIIDRQAGNAGRGQRLQAVRNSLEAIMRLVDDLDQASRVSTGKLTLRPEPLLLHEVLDEAIETALERAGRPSRSVETLLPPGRPIGLQADRTRLHQVFVNLIGNAIKFTRDGGHIWVKATVEALQLVIRVEDDGLGIDGDMLGTIFEMFSQARTAGEHTEGMGIGLALVKNIVELHGGSIQALSKGPGTGAEFVVRLPLGSDPTGPGSQKKQIT
jgi:two-component system CheB/CheR fusion protein